MIYERLDLLRGVADGIANKENLSTAEMFIPEMMEMIEAQAAEIEQLRKVLKGLYFDDYYGIWDNLSANGCCHGFKPAKRCPNDGCRHGELQTNIEAALGETK